MGRNIYKENRIAEKLRSERGASISFALLLFLVCAALSAVILVAATTSAGRMSSIAETDQRYYSVTSAVEFLRDSLSSSKVSVITVNGEEYLFDKPMNQIRNTDIEGMVVDKTADESAESDPKAQNPGKKITGINSDTLTSYFATKPDGVKLTLEPDVGVAGSSDPLSVTIEKGTDSDGNLLLTVYNTAGKPYKVMLVFEMVTDTDVRPPITKTDSFEVLASKEIRWEFTKLVTAYDAG